MTNKKIADPEVILAQMISFLEKEKTTIRERTNIGTSNEHARYGTHNSPSSSRSEPQPITDQQPDTVTTTTTGDASNTERTRFKHKWQEHE
jgi:hypothetical protein